MSRLVATELGEQDIREAALLLLCLGEESGQRINPERIERRAEGSLSRLAYARCQSEGWVDAHGWLTARGRDALQAWEQETS